MGFSYLSAAEFIRWPSTLGTPEGQLEQPQATGTEPQALLGTVFPLQGGAREGLFGRVVRLLQRAEESCEGLKHGYYDLPCIHFLIFLCHDIKNKIRQVGFKKKQNFSKFPKIIFHCRKEIELARCLILGILFFKRTKLSKITKIIFF